MTQNSIVDYSMNETLARKDGGSLPPSVDSENAGSSGEKKKQNCFIEKMMNFDKTQVKKQNLALAIALVNEIQA